MPKTFEISKTSGEVDIVVFNLINHAYDDNEEVRSSILYSLLDISQHQPELVMSSIASYISKRSDRIDMGHRIQLLETLVKISQEAREHVSESVAQDIIAFAGQEMTSIQEIKTDLHTAASDVLVNMALCFPEDVIDNILQTFQPGVEPHYYVMRTLAETASTNSISTVLSLRDVLSRIIPVLGLIKQSPMKWVFSNTLGRIAEAIIFFRQNATPDQRLMVDESAFESDLASAWDVLYNKWLSDSELKVKFCVLGSLGYISGVLGERDFYSRYQKLAVTYLQSYREHSAVQQQLAITQGLSALIIRAMTDDQSVSNNELLLQIMNGLHTAVPINVAISSISSNVTTTNPQNVRNLSEVLRCWETLCRYLPDKTLNLIIDKFQQKENHVRIASLIIIRHLVNALNDTLVNRRSTIISSVNTLTHTNDVTLQAIILQTIASLANQGYLALEGGETLVAFVCQLCSIKLNNSKKDDNYKVIELKKNAEHLLYILSTKVPSALPVLWPFLLELICDKNYYHGLSSIFKCIYSIMESKVAANDRSYILNLEEYVNIAPPQLLVIYFFVLLSQPFSQPSIGLNIAQTALYFGESIHPPLGEYWKTTMPALIEYLQTNNDESTFNLNKWQDTILKVFRETLVTIGNEQWFTDLVAFITFQLKSGGDYATMGSIFNTTAGNNTADGNKNTSNNEVLQNAQKRVKNPEIMRLLYRFLGATLSRVKNKIFITKHIDFLLATVNHKNDAERRGIAQSLGMISNPHLDMVLQRITELLTTTPEHRKSSGFLGFGAKDLGPEDEVKATSVLSYGYITAYAELDLILSRLDVQILHNILPLLGLGGPNKDGTMPEQPAPILKAQLSKAVELIAKTVHPTRLLQANIPSVFILQKRDELAQGMLQFLNEKSEQKPSNELRLSLLTTIATLSLLQPKYPKQMVEKVFTTILPSYQLLLDPAEITTTSGFVNIQSFASKTPAKQQSASSPQQQQQQNFENDDESNTNELPGQTLMNHVNTVWQALVQTDPSINCILQIISKIQPLTAHKNPIVRQRAMTSYLLILKKIVPKLSTEQISQDVMCFPELGKRLAFILPRCSDSIDSIRGMAVECIQAMLYIDQLLNSPGEIKPRQDIKMLSELKNKIVQNIAQPLGAVRWTDIDVVRVLYPLLDQCITIFTNTSTSGDVVEFIRSSIPKLNDVDIQAGLGLSRIVCKAVSLRGKNLHHELSACIEAFLEVLKSPLPKEIRVAVLQSVRLITKMHFNDVMELLLSPTHNKESLPRESCEIFIFLCDPIDNILTPAGDWVEDHDAITFDDMPNNRDLTKRVLEYLCNTLNDTPVDTNLPTSIVMTATCALCAIFNAANGCPPISIPYSKIKPSTDATAATTTSPSTSGKTQQTKSSKTPQQSSTATSSSSSSSSDSDSMPQNKYVFTYSSTQDNASQSALQTVLVSKYSLLISTLLLRLGTAQGVHQNGEQISTKQTVAAIKAFFPSVCQNGVLVSLEDVHTNCYNTDGSKHDVLNNIIKDMNGSVFSTTNLAHNTDFDETIAIITRTLIVDKPRYMIPIVKFLGHFLSQQAYEGQRVAAATILAEFISHTTLPELVALPTPASKDGSEQVPVPQQIQDQLTRLLLPKVADKNDKVRKQALRGLGNFTLVWGTPNIETHATAIISSCNSASEDSSAEVAAEAVSSLTRIAHFVSHDLISPMLVSICFRIRAAFDRKQAKVRQTSFALFAAMCRFGDRYAKNDLNTNFLDQLHANIPIYLVHVCDPKELVSNEAYRGLLTVSTLLHPEIESWLKTTTQPTTEDYNSFIGQFTSLLCQYHTDRIRGYLDVSINYFGSNWNDIRANSAYLTGSLVRSAKNTEQANINSEEPSIRQRLNIHSITAALVKLLDQTDPNVRNQTAKSLALLYDV